MNKRRIYDVTIPIDETIVMYNDELKPTIQQVSSMERGDGYNLTTFTMSAHTGTHVDAPRHFIKDGMTLDQISLDRFVGEVKVFELKGRDRITVFDLEGLPINKGDKVFFKTDNGRLIDEKAFRPDYCALDGSAARYLIERGVSVVGMDYLSVEDVSFGDKVHVILMEAGIIIYEGLDLSRVPEGVYDFAGLPLKLDKCEGAPTRVVLIERD